MTKLRWLCAGGFVVVGAGLLLQAAKIDNYDTGKDAFVDSKELDPGNARKITPKDLPPPFATKSSANFSKGVDRPKGAMPKVMPGFAINVYAEGLRGPRQIRKAPNGDLFVAESNAGQITVLRGLSSDGKVQQTEVFASGMTRPFGIAFYPRGENPQWVYIGNENEVIRFPYRNGDMKARGAAEKIVPDLPTGGFHWTRDVVFTLDGQSMLVAVGSGSNIDDPDTHKTEFHRAMILEYAPDGKFKGEYATGIRNPVGTGIHPTTGELWVSVNERDEIGDNLVPDYVTSVRKGEFFGWPYYYMGGNADPRLNGAHPELKDKVKVPDVLIQPHSASLGLDFYMADQFPAEYKGDVFVAEHGSWNRAVRSGHEIIRIPTENGKATGVYQDFVTGFLAEDGQPWGRPVGVAVGQDGSLFFTDDRSMTVWRVSYTGK